MFSLLLLLQKIQSITTSPEGICMFNLRYRPPTKAAFSSLNIQYEMKCSLIPIQADARCWGLEGYGLARLLTN